MIYYDWTDVSEGVDINKTNESKECDICILVFSKYVIDILNLKGFDYRCNINGITKSEAVNILQKAENYKNNFVLSYIKVECRYVDINKILACDQVSFAKNSLNRFKDHKKSRPLFLMIPKISGYRKCLIKLSIWHF